MTEREALNLALQALETLMIERGSIYDKAITAIKESLAQPEPEYLAFMDTPQRKPLTDEEIILIVAECAASHQHTDIHFARAIERAHGIKELV